MSLLLRGGYVATQDATRRLLKADVFVEGDRIAALGNVAASAEEVVDCTGCVVIPGLINTHNHVANTLLRGAADDVPLEQMLERTFKIDSQFTRRDVQIGALLGCLEMLKAGITSFVDLFYWEDEIARAVTESGIRGFLAWVILDEQFTTQKGSPLKNAEAFIEKHKGAERLYPYAGLQGVYVCSEETLLKTKQMAERLGVPMHMHLSETRSEVYEHRKKRGLRPVEWLEKMGFLSNRLLAAHCVWLTMSEVDKLARHGVKVSHCPVSNMKLASGGVAPLPEMLERGIVCSIGTDSPVSNNGMDLFVDMKMCALLHKSSRWDASVLSAQKTFDLATRDAAAALGMGDRLGSIEVGKKADLAVVDLRQPHTTPFHEGNIISHLVYSCRGSDVKHTIVDGHIVVRDRRSPMVNEEEVLERVQTSARELLGVNG